MLIAHDLGTTGNKATLVDNDGRMLASKTINYGADWGTDGRAEQNPKDWWDAVCQATRALLQETNTAASDVEGVSFSGQMMGAVPLDEKGDPARPAIIWADTRSTKECDQLVERYGMEQCYQVTGHRLNPTYSLTKLMMLRNREPENFSRMKRFCLAKDYVVLKLTGELATDPSDASSTNAFDQNTGDWAWDIIDAAELDHSLFPQVVDSTAVVGKVTAQAARETGLVEGTPVVMGGGDGPMAALGAGVIDATSGAYCYLGSSSWVSLSSNRPLLDPKMRSMTFNHVVPSQFVPTATMQAGGASASWGMEVLSGGSSYEDFFEQAAAVEAATKGLFFLPYLIGERSPHWNPLARGVFAGLHMDHKQAHMMRAVLEGVAFNLNTGLGAFYDAGVTVEHIDLIGGLAKSPVMQRILADVWNVPISPRNIIDEANAIGAAVVAGVGVGVFEDFSIAQRMSSRDADVLPDAAAHEAYGKPYALFLDVYERMENWFAEAHDLAGS
ncbi:xylulokinase [Aestuariimicrobium sp. p3-SID1156]|uniref:xylulokinase n=1 Tax=Aestuariimicrobium sp. p3-SID1156 TaxID=2916038 RepID=UPI00223C2872|nr:xylulokinase [Aestuariimicrobium sp. p3-SID1156]MCT1459771.1 xylulokinase [Aestuariimicrobium sp. p3-SID1156]